MGGSSLVAKILRAHDCSSQPAALRRLDGVTLRPRHLLTHDNTAAILDRFQALGLSYLRRPWQNVIAIDHDIQNPNAATLARHERIESFARAHAIDFHARGQGIGHQIMVEQGYVVPGSLCVASDSHANMYGALGALGIALVRSDAAALWCTGEFWWTVPPVVEVVLSGELAPGVSGKDVILSLCGRFDGGEVLGCALEFTGEGVATLSMDDRLTMANMSTEWGAVAGVFPVDARTVEFMRIVERAMIAAKRRRFSEDAKRRWELDPVAADPDAGYDGRIALDLASVRPVVSGPRHVHATRPVAPLVSDAVKVDKAYLLSCVNGRLDDLRVAAAVLRGHRVADSVEFYVAAASAAIERQARDEGVWQVLDDAGARFLPPGCGPCIGLGEGLLREGEVAVSATNRNFDGRMGAVGAEVYLASPAVVAASARAGFLALDDEAPSEPTALRATIEPVVTGFVGSPRAKIESARSTVQGRGLFLDIDHLDTDAIYAGIHTYRELTPSEMAAVVLEHRAPDFTSRARPGDVLIGGSHFGVGSSREQAVTALRALGIGAVIAASFGATFLRNAFNDGMICVSCPEFVRWLREQRQDPALLSEVEDTVSIDVDALVLRCADRDFGFAPIGEIPRMLVDRGGMDPYLRRRFALPPRLEVADS